jgi:putative ABC transport system substrate-binding protein
LRATQHVLLAIGGRQRGFAARLSGKCDLIVGGARGARAKWWRDHHGKLPRRETRTIPIVFVTVSDPIGGGFAASFARPGGNITGFTFVEAAIGGKWVELLKEIEPRTVRVALLFNPATAPPLKFYMPSIQAAESSLAVQASAAPVHAKDEIEGVIAAQARNPGGSLIVMPDAFNGDLIIALAARYGVPS